MNAEVVKLQKEKGELLEILKALYEHDKDYIEINHLGHPNHNLVMWNAFDALRRHGVRGYPPYAK
ncbi:MAG TPA: hypothetical protein VLF94_07890 [Chlamydiales bacterium]|nr:hypothetical protein [Chlamydiales bacterium]